MLTVESAQVSHSSLSGSLDLTTCQVTLSDAHSNWPDIILEPNMVAWLRVQYPNHLATAAPTKRNLMNT